MSSGGFTEDDQARIAAEIESRAPQTRRVGLGFGGGAHTPAEASTSQSSSSWFQQARDATPFVSSGAAKDTTGGAFPWDGGQRGNSGARSRRNDAAPTSHSSEPADQGRPKERQFPMVRDRDIEMTMTGRDAARVGKARDRSRSRSNSRERLRRRASRNRSRSRDRERERGYYRARWPSGDGERDRDRHRQRDRDRNTEKERERGGERERERHKDRHRRDRSIPDNRTTRDRLKDRRGTRDHHSERHRDRGVHDHTKDRDNTSEDYSSPVMAAEMGAGKETRSLPTAKQAKDAMKQRLKKTVAGDVTLKTGFKAALGGGGGWERPEMAEAADFFKNDEVEAKGGVASVRANFGYVVIFRA